MRSRAFIVTSITCLSLVAPLTAKGAPLLSLRSDAPADEAGEAPEAAEEPSPEEAQANEEEALEQAKALYAQAEKKAKRDKWKEAKELYEQAYYLVPGKHGFAFKVGEAAYEADDCDSAVEYLVHFMEYSDPEKHGDKRKDARKILRKLLDKGCVEEEALRGTHLNDAEREERARELYSEAEGLMAKEKWREAMDLYEQAYYLVPLKHGFAHKVGLAAYEAGECDKAHQYLIHFVDYADPNKYGDRMSEASHLINELEDSGCVTQEELEAHQLENPFEITHDDERRDDKHERGPAGGLLIAGGALIGVGVAGGAVGAVGFVLAGGSQRKLDGLASTDTVSGYPDGDYSCREVSGDQCPPTLEQQVANRQLMGLLGVSIGGAAILGGAALIAVSASRRKKGAGSSARLDAIGPVLLPGGAGARASLRF